jgi:hypothetical protein
LGRTVGGGAGRSSNARAIAASVAQFSLRQKQFPRRRKNFPVAKRISPSRGEFPWRESVLERMSERGTELICPYRRNNRRRRHYDGRKLRRYKHRWIVERTISWLGNYRRVLIRWERNVQHYLAFVHVACLMIALRQL